MVWSIVHNGRIYYPTPNIRYNGSTALNVKMSIGESIVVTLITTANASAYSANITIDAEAVTERWIGGSAPDTGGSSGVDIHLTIIKMPMQRSLSLVTIL